MLFRSLGTLAGGVAHDLNNALAPVSISIELLKARHPEEAATLALRTQQVLAFESGVTADVDPFGGSYFVEALTREMEDGALAYFEQIDRMGGMVAAIERGFPQREIAEASYRFQQAVERREKVIVGVNDYVQAGEPPFFEHMYQPPPDELAPGVTTVTTA